MDDNFFIPACLWQPEGKSYIESKSVEERKRIFSLLSDKEKAAFKYCWELWAREKQLPPPIDIINHPLGWKYWVFLGGRGTGKTKLAAEYTRYRVEKGLSKRIALIGPTYRDVISTMVKGESGLQSVFTPDWTLRLNKSEGILHFEHNKEEVAQAFIYTGEEPERLRGPQHDFAWIDEVAAFKYLQEVWQLFVPGLRLGSSQAIFTTTPKASLLKISLLQDERTVCTFGESKENESNLTEGWLKSIEDVYKDTDLGEQELKGKLRLDESGSLFRQSYIHANRVSKPVKKGNFYFIDSVKLEKIIVAIDPSGSSKNSACECGIIVAALGSDNNGYILEDLSFQGSPADWAMKSIQAAATHGAQVIYESNYGDEIVGTVLRKVANELNVKVSIKDVRAEKDKYQRAMPISALCQKGRVKFAGTFRKLELQMTTWTPGDKSPDRMDAFVWAMTDLLLKQSARGIIDRNLFPF